MVLLLEEFSELLLYICVSVKHWSHKRLRGSTVRSVWETMWTSTTITTPSHTHMHSKSTENPSGRKTVSPRFYQIYLIIESVMGEFKAAVQRQDM